MFIQIHYLVFQEENLLTVSVEWGHHAGIYPTVVFYYITYTLQFNISIFTRGHSLLFSGV